MTYPPQPGQPPYDQQPGGQYGVPPSGGFPQQSGGQYPAIPGYPQGQYPHGPQGGFGPQPPKKSKTGLWVGLGIGVVAVVVFVITAFVAPGFLLSDDDDDGNTVNDTANGDGGGGAQALAEQIRDALNAQDTTALQGLICPDATPMVQGIVSSSAQISDVEIQGQVQENGDTATVTANVTYAGQPVNVENTLANQNGTWCWQDLVMNTPGMPSTPGDAGGMPEVPDSSDTGNTSSAFSAEAGTFVKQVESALNSGDNLTLSSMICEGYEDEVSGLDSAVAAGVTFTVSKTEKVENEEIPADVEMIQSYLTANDDSVLTIGADNAEGTFCIFLAEYW